jgi:hypothetical protein
MAAVVIWGKAIAMQRDEIPELVCQASERTSVSHDSLETSTGLSSLQIRIRGNFLYEIRGGSEQLMEPIYRLDRRRWSSGDRVLLLDSNVESGTLLEIKPSSTQIHRMKCKAILPRRL